MNLVEMIGTTFVRTFLPSPNATTLVTYYFRKSFNLTSARCYNLLTLTVLVHDGTIIYLNNVEAIKFNLPLDYVDNKTNVTPSIQNFLSFTSKLFLNGYSFFRPLLLLDFQIG